MFITKRAQEGELLVKSRKGHERIETNAVGSWDIVTCVVYLS